MEVTREVEIDAPPRAVWRVLADIDAYERWNPYLTRVEGALGEGETLRVRIRPPGAPGMNLRPTVTLVEPERELRWTDRLLVPKLFAETHAFRIEPLDDERARFAHAESVEGLLAPRLVRPDARREGIDRMNRALGKRAERRATEEAYGPTARDG